MESSTDFKDIINEMLALHDDLMEGAHRVELAKIIYKTALLCEKKELQNAAH